MEPVSPTNSTVLEYLKAQCNAYVNGECHTRACLVRGGYRGSAPIDYDMATCVYREAIEFLRSNLELLQEIHDALRYGSDTGTDCYLPANLVSRITKALMDGVTEL
jgi:hypothetical protein